MKKGITRTVAMAGICALVGATIANAEIGYFNGFEGGSAAGLLSYQSDVSVVASGTGGITSSDGLYHAVIKDPDTLPSGYFSGAFDTFGANNSSFGNGWSSSVDVYIDLQDSAVAAGTYGFDYTIAINNSAGTHAQDNIFHVGALDDGLGGYDLALNASHNTDFVLNTFKLQNGLGTMGTLTQSGWYTFEVAFSESATPDAVDIDFSVYDEGGSLFWTASNLSNPAQYTLSTAGGDRYGWFTYSAATELAVDNIAVIPEPASIAMIGMMGGMGLFIRRRFMI